MSNIFNACCNLFFVQPTASPAYVFAYSMYFSPLFYPYRSILFIIYILRMRSFTSFRMTKECVRLPLVRGAVALRATEGIVILSFVIPNAVRNLNFTGDAVAHTIS